MKAWTGGGARSPNGSKIREDTKSSFKTANGPSKSSQTMSSFENALERSFPFEVHATSFFHPSHFFHLCEKHLKPNSFIILIYIFSTLVLYTLWWRLLERESHLERLRSNFLLKINRRERFTTIPLLQIHLLGAFSYRTGDSLDIQTSGDKKIIWEEPWLKPFFYLDDGYTTFRFRCKLKRRLIYSHIQNCFPLHIFRTYPPRFQNFSSVLWKMSPNWMFYS